MGPVKKPSRTRPLAEGIDALARAAGRTSARRSGKAGRIAFSVPPPALAGDELLIVVADARSVALKLVKARPRPPRPAPGAPAPLEQVARRIAEIDAVAAEITGEPRRAGASPPPLSAEEERLLRDGKLNVRPLAPSERQGVYRATAEYAKLLTDSYTVEQAARLLGVNTSRIRQRLIGAPRTLFGIKLGKAWRVPRFQFQGRRLVPGIETVLQRIPAGLHPVAVSRWFMSANSDLTGADDAPMSPLDWLRVGHSAAAAAELAADL
jgi:hypothetical protein